MRYKWTSLCTWEDETTAARLSQWVTKPHVNRSSNRCHESGNGGLKDAVDLCSCCEEEALMFARLELIGWLGYGLEAV